MTHLRSKCVFHLISDQHRCISACWPSCSHWNHQVGCSIIAVCGCHGEKSVVSCSVWWHKVNNFHDINRRRWRERIPCAIPGGFKTSQQYHLVLSKHSPRSSLSQWAKAQLSPWRCCRRLVQGQTSSLSDVCVAGLYQRTSLSECFLYLMPWKLMMNSQWDYWCSYEEDKLIERYGSDVIVR